MHAHDSAVNGEWADAKHEAYQGKLLGVAAIQQRVFAVASQSGGSALVGLDDGDDAQRQATAHGHQNGHAQVIRRLVFRDDWRLDVDNSRLSDDWRRGAIDVSGDDVSSRWRQVSRDGARMRDRRGGGRVRLLWRWLGYFGVWRRRRLFLLQSSVFVHVFFFVLRTIYCLQTNWNNLVMNSWNKIRLCPSFDWGTTKTEFLKTKNE